MLTAYASKYGSPEIIELRQVDLPPVKADEALVRVLGSSVNAADLIYLSGRPLVLRIAAGPFRPQYKTLGRDVAGVLEEVGADVTAFKAGDEVYGEINFGAFAEFVSVPEHLLAHKPANLSFEAAAAVPLAAITALQGLRDTGKLQPGQRVLVNGAAGGVGSFAVQIAKALGAEVTAVCSTDSLDLVRSLGADHIIDYTQEDFTRTGQRWDIIFDLVSNRPLRRCRHALSANGIYVPAGGKVRSFFKAFVVSLFTRRVKMFVAKSNRPDLEVIRNMIERGQVVPVVEQISDLGEVAKALHTRRAGHARGKTVISIGGGANGALATGATTDTGEPKW